MVRRARPRAAVDPTRCPVCGETNQCAGAAGTGGACWCRSAVFSFELLASAGSGRACICQRCLRASRARASAE